MVCRNVSGIKLSIILISYNTQQLLQECLESLFENIDTCLVEIIVVDNNSADSSADMVQERFPSVIFIQNTDNLGFARANNIGIKHSSGDNILLLNTDTIIVEDFVSPIINYLKDAPDVGVLGCRVLNEDHSLQYTCWRSPTVFTGLSFYTIEIIKNILNPLSYWRYMKYWDHLSVRDVDCVSGCFMWIRRAVIDLFGGLDENIFMYYEDSEFCVRVRKQSDYRVVYFPGTCIVHLGGMSGDNQASNPDVLRYDYQSFNYYLSVTRGVFRQRIFMMFCVLIWRVELAIFSLFKNNNRFAKKYRLIKWLLSDK